MFTESNRINHIIKTSGGNNSSFIPSQRVNIKDDKENIKEKKYSEKVCADKFKVVSISWLL